MTEDAFRLQLRRPDTAMLASYVDALERGWSPRNVDGERARLDTLARIRRSETAFLAEFADGDTVGPPITLPDGREVPRLPDIARWMWDGEFAGLINLRWVPGTDALPDHVLGHLGYTVVPWKRNRGYATQALAGMLWLAKDQGLNSVELTTTQDNVASIRTIEKNGGQHVRDMTGVIHHDADQVVLLYRIVL